MSHFNKPFEEFNEVEILSSLIQNLKRDFMFNEAKLRHYKKLKVSRKHPISEIKLVDKQLTHQQTHIVGFIEELKAMKDEYEKY